MIWDFQDGTDFESAYGVVRFDSESAEDVADTIKKIIPNAKVLPRDPIADYERIHRQAAVELKGTDRAKRAFLESALIRVARMGPGILLAVFEGDHELRIVATRERVSILKPKGTQLPALAALADEIAVALGGRATEVRY